MILHFSSGPAQEFILGDVFPCSKEQGGVIPKDLEHTILHDGAWTQKWSILSERKNIDCKTMSWTGRKQGDFKPNGSWQNVAFLYMFIPAIVAALLAFSISSRLIFAISCEKCWNSVSLMYWCSASIPGLELVDVRKMKFESVQTYTSYLKSVLFVFLLRFFCLTATSRLMRPDVPRRERQLLKTVAVGLVPWRRFCRTKNDCKFKWVLLLVHFIAFSYEAMWSTASQVLSGWHSLGDFNCRLRAKNAKYRSQHHRHRLLRLLSSRTLQNHWNRHVLWCAMMCHVPWFQFLPDFFSV